MRPPRAALNGRFTPRLVLSGALILASLGAIVWAQDSAGNFSLIKDAAQAIVAGDLKRAETELLSVLATAPDDYRALNLMGVVRAQQQREAESEKLFLRATELKPDFAGAHANLGHLYQQTRRDDEALTQYEEALRLDNSREDVRASLVTLARGVAQNAVRAGNPEKGLAALLAARKQAPEDPNLLFDFGMVALRMSLLPDAVEAFQQELQLKKDDPNGLYGLGRAQIGLAKYQDAKVSFETFVKLRPDDPAGHYALGLVLQSLQQSAEARQEFAKSIELQPVQTEAYFQLGLMDVADKDLETASERFRRVLQRDPKHTGALFGLGRVAFERKDYPTAAEQLEQATASDPSMRQAHYYLGLTYARMGRKDDSDRELATASRLEHEEVEKHRYVMKILGPDEAPVQAEEQPK